MAGEVARFALAGVALFLLGANVAFLVHVRNFVRWFCLKVVAVALLLVYVATSALCAERLGPGTVTVGLVAVVVDVAAMYRMWSAIDRAPYIRNPEEGGSNAL